MRAAAQEGETTVYHREELMPTLVLFTIMLYHQGGVIRADIVVEGLPRSISGNTQKEAMAPSMYEILVTEELKPVTRLFQVRVAAAHKSQAGQFAIVRIHERGKRIPLTIAVSDRQQETITLVARAGHCDHPSHSGVRQCPWQLAVASRHSRPEN